MNKIFEIKEDKELGTIVYKNYNSSAICNFDKDVHVCEVPFYDVEIKQDGNVFLCCPAWNPVSIGNLLHQDIKTIWNGTRATIVRDSILDSSYRYCDARTCPAMIAGAGDRIKRTEQFSNPNRTIPRNFAFSIDNTCNLQCPSCRRSKITTTSNEFRKQALTILKNVFSSLFQEPHNEEVIMTFDGAGEIFHSAVYKEIFENETSLRDFDKWPNLKVVLCTNGTMMTEKIQQKYDYLFRRSLGVRISVDAGNKESYEKVRMGGDWELLWDNINYLYNNTLKHNPSKSWSWNLILQDDNFESLPELVNKAYEYSDNLPEIYITNMLDWDVLGKEVYEEKAVWLPTSTRHSQMKEVLSLPNVVSYPKIFKPF